MTKKDIYYECENAFALLTTTSIVHLKPKVSAF